jgi:hypothetical protein
MAALTPFVPFVDELPLCAAGLNDSFTEVNNGTSFNDNVLTSRVVALNTTLIPVPVFSFSNPQAATVQFTGNFTMQAAGLIQVNLYGYFRPLAVATGTYGISINIDAGINLMEKVITNPSAIGGYNTWSSVKILGPFTAGVHTIQLVKTAFGTAGGAVEWAPLIEIIEL